MRRPASLPLESAGSSIPARIAMMAMTTSSSISVNAPKNLRPLFGGIVVFILIYVFIGPKRVTMSSSFQRADCPPESPNARCMMTRIDDGLFKPGFGERRSASVFGSPDLAD